MKKNEPLQITLVVILHLLNETFYTSKKNKPYFINLYL